MRRTTELPECCTEAVNRERDGFAAWLRNRAEEFEFHGDVDLSEERGTRRFLDGCEDQSERDVEDLARMLGPLAPKGADWDTLLGVVGRLVDRVERGR